MTEYRDLEKGDILEIGDEWYYTDPLIGGDWYKVKNHRAGEACRGIPKCRRPIEEVEVCNHIIGYAQDIGYPPCAIKDSEPHKPDHYSIQYCKHCPDCGVGLGGE